MYTFSVPFYWMSISQVFHISDASEPFSKAEYFFCEWDDWPFTASCLSEIRWKLYFVKWMNQNCMYLNVKFTCGSGLSVYAWVYVFFSTYVVVSISAWRIRIKVLLLFSRPVMSDFLWTHGLQHARPLCPSPSPGVCPSSCSLHW